MSYTSDSNATYVNGQPVNKADVRSLWSSVDKIVNGLRDAGTLRTVNVAGTGNAITADLSDTMANAGISGLSGAADIEYIPVATNEADNPTITIAGATYGIRNADGGTWPAGGFVIGRSYKLRRRGTSMRVIAGDVTSIELSSARADLDTAIAGEIADRIAADDAIRASKADLQNSGKFFTSRDAAVAAGQSALPAALARLVVEEGDYIVWRGPGQTDDQLFSSYPNWGIVRRVPTQQVVDDLLADKADLLDSGKIYNSRQAAIDRGPAHQDVGRIITVESGGLAIRAPFQSDDDPLFETGVLWGVVARVPAASAANTFTTSGGSTGPSGKSDIPYNSTFVIILNNAQSSYSMWRAVGAPDPPVEQDNIKQSSDGRWWLLVHDEETLAEQSSRIDVDRVASLIPIVSVTVSEIVDGITTLIGTVSGTAADNGVVPVSGSIIRFTMPSGATGPLRLNIEGDTDRALMDERNVGPLTAEEVTPNSILVFERRGGNWVLVSGRRPEPFIGDESFRAPDAMDEVWYKILTARDGSAWLGSYIDGSWAAPTAFGAFRWPGDDLVILETQSGEPILAVAPDGTLIFKERS